MSGSGSHSSLSEHGLNAFFPHHQHRDSFYVKVTRSPKKTQLILHFTDIDKLKV
jgi:hypothetical protein